MKILIIEDEQNNADRLVRLIRTIKPDAEIADVLSSNEEIKQFFERETVSPDVIFADIQLGDGLSFEGLKLAPQSVPVIFTTAYDKYAIQAFKFNSLDYLLKPIDFDELRLALLKVEKKTVATLEAVSHLLET
ncbi:MAG: response regulator, partial [Bacteroidales bacterium]|nr:response regulator [Bacteroidales bacterium]